MRIIKINYIKVLIFKILYFKMTLNIQQGNYVFNNIYEDKITLKALNKIEIKNKKVFLFSFFLIYILYCKFQ
jgi:hypothetical protein